jgi:hypothetical protein
MTQTATQMLRAAWPLHKDDAVKAFDMFESWNAARMRGVPGIGTVERLAVRLYLGKTVEQAAAAEYVYRWYLAIKAPDQCFPAHGEYLVRNPVVSIFGTPHTLGM